MKTRLAILRRAPAHYAVELARKEFSWIDEKFVPISQSQELQPVHFSQYRAVILEFDYFI